MKISSFTKKAAASFKRSAYIIGQTIKRKAPEIMTIISAFGVGATAVLAVKATPKAIEKIESDSRKNHNGDPYAYTKTEAIKSCWTDYITAALTGVATVGCMFGANAANKQQRSAITSAYIMVSKAYQEYKDKVYQLYGEEGSKQINSAVLEAKVEKCDISVPDENSESLLFYNEYYGDFFNRTKEQVLSAEYHFNRNFALRGYANINEFFAFLGLDKTESGDELGWSMDVGFEYYGYSWVDFKHELVTMMDGMECYIIDTPFPPTMDFMN